MVVLDALYFFIFRIYAKSKVESEPHSTTVFAMSFLQISFVFFVVQLLIAYFECIVISFWWGIVSLALATFFNYLYFIRSKRSIKILTQKTYLFQNKLFSDVFVGTMLVIMLSSIFVGPIMMKEFLSACD